MHYLRTIRSDNLFHFTKSRWGRKFECSLTLLFLLVIYFVQAGYAQQESSRVDSLRIHQIQQPLVSSLPQMIPRTPPSTNPDMSAIGDFRSAYTRIGKRKYELFLNELEIQVVSVVDPYARAEFLFSFGKEDSTGELGIELEVATLTSLSFPYQIQFTVGKFKPQFGKVNILHPHYFSFIDFPKVINNFFDSEGMFMEGVSISWLIPNPLDFYQELVFETGRAGSEPNASVVPGQTDRLLTIGHLKNFFDFTENATLEFGLSALSGPNQYNLETSMASIDLTYKWKPLQLNTYKSLIWQCEALINKTRISQTADIRSWGGYSFIEYQVKKRWFVGIRYDYSGFPDDRDKKERAGTLLFRFQPTEFQILALQYQYTDRNDRRDYSQITFRVIFGIGKHAAHSY